MRMTMLGGLAAIALGLVACGGGAGGSVKYAPTVVPIKHLDFTGVELDVEQFQHPPFADQYPAVVVTVNGQPVTGDDLARQEVTLELTKRSYGDTGVDSLDLLLATREAKVAATDPLEAAIDDQLKQQAAQRLGLAPPRETAVAYTAQLEASSHEALAHMDPERRAQELEMLREQGFPDTNWADSDIVVGVYSNVLALGKLEKEYCKTNHPTPQTPTPGGNAILGFANLFSSVDCSAFLASERKHADIVYYVRWAE